MILAGGVGGSGILFIWWVGSRGRCRSKVGTPAKEHNPVASGPTARRRTVGALRRASTLSTQREGGWLPVVDERARAALMRSLCCLLASLCWRIAGAPKASCSYKNVDFAPLNTAGVGIEAGVRHAPPTF
eukprot:COSAG02_NODE_2270_length_9267_cov_13.803992_7_plen_130_part_00